MKPHNACLLLSILLSLAAQIPSQVPRQSTPEQQTEMERLAQQAEADLRNQKLDLAAADYQKILALDPGNVNARSNLGLVYYMQQKFAAAAEQFNVALQAKPDLWNIVALCGLSEARIQQNAKAATHLEQAFQHVADPSLRLAVGKQLYSIRFDSGDLSRAADVVDQLQQLDPKNADVLYAAHQVYSLLANRAFLTLARLEPDSARMYQLWGDRMTQLGDSKGAVTAYRKAIERDSNLSGVHVALGDALSLSRSPADRAAAEAEYQKALAVNPLDERAESKLGDIAFQHSDLELASRRYKLALQLQPDDPEANEGLGNVFLQSQSYQDARTYLRRAAQLDPTNSIAYYQLSQASKKLGDLDAAKQEMDQFLKLKAESERMKHSFSSMPLGQASSMPKSADANGGQGTGSQRTSDSQTKSPR